MGDVVKTEFENLNAEMGRAGLSYSAMAEMIGIGVSTIYNKRTGKQDWTLQEMTSIQKILQGKTGLDLPLDYLFKAGSRKVDVMGENISNY